jgi:hypothetical protein
MKTYFLLLPLFVFVSARAQQTDRITLAQSFHEQPARGCTDFKRDMIKAYGPELGEVISNGKVLKGMTTGMCYMAWGKPEDKTQVTLGKKKYDVWIYSDDRMLLFINDKLKHIMNMED